ncbi:MAG TPA: OmpH family outer membrane protein, partial [Bacteroidales bacterium]|nr:OmpH family outer membrane protein [Bacteroidales bacterium]
NKPGTGEVLYIDVDSINANYLLMEQLKAELEAEQNKQQAAFSARQNAFQKKYAQFQKNYQAGILTEAQVQNTNSQLEAESQKLEADYQQAIDDLSKRQYEANNRMLDSVKNVAARINQKRNASYILTYQKDVPFMIYKDPTKDITEEVLFELNKPFKNKENK